MAAANVSSQDERQAQDIDARRCVRCSGTLAPRYFRVNGGHVCQGCWTRMRGSNLRAVLYGAFAGAMATGLYYAIYALSGFRFAIVAIIAGVAVGTAVRRGNGVANRPWLRGYAVVMAYLATVLTYAHVVLSMPYIEGWSSALLTSLTLPYWMVPELPKNIVTLVLLVLGLHEAYAFSRPVPVNVQGPFELRSASEIEQGALASAGS